MTTLIVLALTTTVIAFMLSAGETALAHEAFGDALHCDSIRILSALWPFNRAFVPGRWFGREWIVWPRRTQPTDIAAAPLRQQSTLIHELTHVWQAQQGVNLLLAKLGAGDQRESYVYPVDDACDWAGLNIEQQAMAVEHAFRLTRGGGAPAAGAFYRAVLPFAHCEAYRDLDARSA